MKLYLEISLHRTGSVCVHLPLFMNVLAVAAGICLYVHTLAAHRDIVMPLETSQTYCFA